MGRLTALNIYYKKFYPSCARFLFYFYLIFS